MKKLMVSCMLSLGLALGLGSAGIAANTQPKPVEAQVNINTTQVMVNQKVLDVNTMMYNGRLYIPIRNLCYYFKTEVQVDNKTNQVNLILGKGSNEKNKVKQVLKLKGKQKIKLYTNTYQLQADGLDTFMDSISYNNVVYIPIRYFAEMFDKKIDWDKKKNAVIIADQTQSYVGSVNGSKISKSDYDFYYKIEERRVKSQMGEKLTDEVLKLIKEKAFDSSVEEKLFIQKVKENKIVMTDEDVKRLNEQMKSIVDQNGGTTKLRESLDELGISLYQFIQKYQKISLADKYLIPLMNNVKVTEEDIKAYYEENKAKIINPEMVKAKHILFASINTETREPLSSDKIAEAKKKADETLEKIKAGEDFDKLMNELSQDPGLTTSPDGYTFARGQMHKPFEDAAFSLKVGEVSEVVETESGYHIIKLIDRIPEETIPFDEVKDQIKPMLEQQARAKFFEETMKSWKSNSKIVNELK